MLATVAAADSASTVRKSTAFLYIAKRNHMLCTLYINRRIHCVFYSNKIDTTTTTNNNNNIIIIMITIIIMMTIIIFMIVILIVLLLPTTLNSLLCQKGQLIIQLCQEDGLFGDILVIAPIRSKLKILHITFCLS